MQPNAPLNRLLDITYPTLWFARKWRPDLFLAFNVDRGKGWNGVGENTVKRLSWNWVSRINNGLRMKQWKHTRFGCYCMNIVPTFADRGCSAVSATDPHAVNFNFLDPEPLLFHLNSSAVILMRLSGPRSRTTAPQKVWKRWKRRESNPRSLDL
jgi:hypothetical protein